ncbi:PKD domain-containing protein [Kitasatospora gansuensis]
MRSSRVAGLAALVLSVTGGLPLALPASAAAGTLYVDNNVNCSDTGGGSQALPYCTVGAAAKAAQPGQTVRIGKGRYEEPLVPARSGTPGSPITFTGAGGSATELDNGGPAVSLVGLHDVVVSGLKLTGHQEVVAIRDSSRIGLDGLTVNGVGTAGRAGVWIGPGSAEVTLSRTRITSDSGAGVQVEGGATGVVLTTNLVSAVNARGIAVTDSPGAVVNGNSVYGSCGPGVELAGASGGAVVKNNALTLATPGDDPCKDVAPVDLAVSAASVPGTVADYNYLATGTSRPYRWAGTEYRDVAAFRAATGQGGHDLSGPRGLPTNPVEYSPLIDSADPTAPGTLATDLNGRARTDDPLVANSGTGNGFHDRGAVERQDPFTFDVDVQRSFTGDSNTDITISDWSSSPWTPGAAVDSSVDFGDGSARVSPIPAQLTHTYPRFGSYTVTATATNALGVARTVVKQVTVAEPVLKPSLTVSRQDDLPLDTDPLRVKAIAGAETSRPVTGYSYDFGDGTPAGADASHRYAKPGSYTVTVTATDTKGRTAKASSPITVGGSYQQLYRPSRLLDSRTGGQPVRSGQILSIDVTSNVAAPEDGQVTAVLLNLTATDASGNGFVTAYPGGSARPTVSSLNYATGQTVANSVVVPVGPDGTVQIYNGGPAVALLADITGYWTVRPNGPANNLTSAQQTRVLDSRTGVGVPKNRIGGALAPVTFQVRDTAGLPPEANAVVLNVTATESAGPGYLTANTASDPATSSLNYAAGQTVANQVTLPIAPDGTVTLYNVGSSLHLVADVQGFYSTAHGAPYVATAPTRLLDTREGGRTISPAGSVRVKVAGVAGAPAGVRSVLVNLTVTGPTTGAT